MKDKHYASAVKEITLSVIAAVAAILGAVLVCEFTNLVPLFVGMVAVLVYMSFLAVYFRCAFPRAHTEISFPIRKTRAVT